MSCFANTQLRKCLLIYRKYFSSQQWMWVSVNVQKYPYEVNCKSSNKKYTDAFFFYNKKSFDKKLGWSSYNRMYCCSSVCEKKLLLQKRGFLMGRRDVKNSQSQRQLSQPVTAAFCRNIWVTLFSSVAASLVPHCTSQQRKTKLWVWAEEFSHQKKRRERGREAFCLVPFFTPTLGHDRKRVCAWKSACKRERERGGKDWISL